MQVPILLLVSIYTPQALWLALRRRWGELEEAIAYLLIGSVLVEAVTTFLPSPTWGFTNPTLALDAVGTAVVVATIAASLAPPPWNTVLRGAVKAVIAAAVPIATLIALHDAFTALLPWVGDMLAIGLGVLPRSPRGGGSLIATALGLYLVTALLSAVAVQLTPPPAPPCLPEPGIIASHPNQVLVVLNQGWAFTGSLGFVVAPLCPGLNATAAYWDWLSVPLNATVLTATPISIAGASLNATGMEILIVSAHVPNPIMCGPYICGAWLPINGSAWAVNATAIAVNGTAWAWAGGLAVFGNCSVVAQPPPKPINESLTIGLPNLPSNLAVGDYESLYVRGDCLATLKPGTPWGGAPTAWTAPMAWVVELQSWAQNLLGGFAGEVLSRAPYLALAIALASPFIGWGLGGYMWLSLNTLARTIVRGANRLAGTISEVRAQLLSGGGGGGREDQEQGG